MWPSVWTYAGQEVQVFKGVPHYILFYHMDNVTKPVLQMIRPGTSQTVQTQELRGSYGNEIQIMIILYLFLGWGDFYSL